VAAIRASHSAQPASDSAPKTQDTSGRLSQPELLSCDQVPAFLKTSKDIAALGFPTCCKTWQEWVTERRGAYSQRLKSAQSISVSGSSSWPTANARDWKDSITGTHPPSRPKIGEQTLGQAVSVMHGQAARASSNTNGNRQESWPTPDTQTGPHGARGVSSNPNHQSAKSLEATARQWATPQAHDAQGPKTPEQIAAMRAKGHGVKNLNEMVSWATPQAKDHKSGHRDPTIVQYKQLNVEVEARATGKLNPRWVETLMGLPIGWTMPSCTSPQTIAPMSCDSSAMESCLPPQSELSEFSLAS
jgi:hypothetical protein